MAGLIHCCWIEKGTDISDHRGPCLRIEVVFSRGNGMNILSCDGNDHFNPTADSIQFSWKSIPVIQSLWEMYWSSTLPWWEASPTMPVLPTHTITYNSCTCVNYFHSHCGTIWQIRISLASISSLLLRKLASHPRNPQWMLPRPQQCAKSWKIQT